MLDNDWLRSALGGVAAEDELTETDSTQVFRRVVQDWAREFAERRVDVASPEVRWPSRGLCRDEVVSFMRSWHEGLVEVDDAGYFSLPSLGPRTPGRYSMLSKSGTGVSLNLEYLIQIGATAELILDHGWPVESVEFERGEFDAFGLSETGQVALAMEAKARATGPDSLESLLRGWMAASADPTISLETNAGRKLRELRRLTIDRPVLVWLVASGARWPLWAEVEDGELVLSPGGAPDRPVVLNVDASRGEPMMRESFAYDASHHHPRTAAARGGCSWHGPTSCPHPPVISFQDASRAWQSGCQRAFEELTSRGELPPPASPGHGR